MQTTKTNGFRTAELSDPELDFKLTNIIKQICNLKSSTNYKNKGHVVNCTAGFYTVYLSKNDIYSPPPLQTSYFSPLVASCGKYRYPTM
jgi:hypothetical protein